MSSPTPLQPASVIRDPADARHHIVPDLHGAANDPGDPIEPSSPQGRVTPEEPEKLSFFDSPLGIVAFGMVCMFGILAALLALG